MPALNERRQRLTERRAGNPKLIGEAAFGRESCARPQQADPDRGAQSFDRFLECGRGPNGLEDSRECGVSLHGAKGTAIGPKRSAGTGDKLPGWPAPSTP